MFAMLLATTSSSRWSAICRDNPIRRAFSIGLAPLGEASALPGGTIPTILAGGSPKPQPLRTIAGDVPETKFELNQQLDCEAWRCGPGKFIPPKPRTRQIFPRQSGAEI